MPFSSVPCRMGPQCKCITRQKAELHTFGSRQGLASCCITWDALSNGNQVSLSMQKGNFLLQTALSSLGETLE